MNSTRFAIDQYTLDQYTLASRLCGFFFIVFSFGSVSWGNHPFEDHWSFQKIKRPAVPRVQWRNWARNPIDLFVLEKCETQNMRPLAAANRPTLIRRVSFDIRGLPPSKEELETFNGDGRVDAYERMIDRMLGSPGYGIHRAQHWLDLARFAETDGFEHDKIRGEAWKYRDWVVQAFNRDVPYDRFLLQQLAGDETDSPSKIPTAFCLSGPDMPDINSQEERRQNVLNELTATIGASLLGLQIGCAQCHDHKYDPISQLDFYRMRAVFEPALNVKKNVSLSFLQGSKGRHTQSYALIRGEWNRKGDEVQADVPEVLGKNLKFHKASLEHSTGRRTGFARWLAAESNPLTARVIANRVWQYHFGVGLVESANDFGLMGEVPSHPELLDWLAVELMESGWSLKHLSRLILTSATYQQLGSIDSGNRDQTRKWLVGFPRRRLSGESIRDAMLAVSNALTGTMGGPGVRPPIPKELSQTLLKNHWVTSKNQADHYRRSIYVFARRNLRYPLFEAFDRPDGNQSCPRRNRSTTAPQSLHLLNSELVLELARRLAGSVLAEKLDIEEAIESLFMRVYSRKPERFEVETALQFINEQAASIENLDGKNLATPIPLPAETAKPTGVAFAYLCLALFNTNEFIYLD